ncbi:MAG: riboflavin synthase [Kiloniellales bacterium]|nr:riboflavin synthase [Kiloniellales bacterium]
MFTGIITDLGSLRSLEQHGDTRFVFETSYGTHEIEIGASIACSGVCLTVVDKGPGWFATDASAETLSKTTLGSWIPGRRVNLERALKLGDELGGHLVSGHVDGIAAVLSIEKDGDSLRFLLEAPQDLAYFIAKKGSVTLDGVSLTVNAVEGQRFAVNIIPHTAALTTFGKMTQGDKVNLEIDLIARYLQRLTESKNSLPDCNHS